MRRRKCLGRCPARGRSTTTQTNVWLVWLVWVQNGAVSTISCAPTENAGRFRTAGRADTQTKPRHSDARPCLGCLGHGTGQMKVVSATSRTLIRVAACAAATARWNALWRARCFFCDVSPSAAYDL